jgi:hypothetical protein
VVVSLLYVGFQVRQNTTQLRQDNLREIVRGTLDTNWLFHRDSEAFDVFRRGVHSFHGLEPREKAFFHSMIVDLAFYFEIVRNMQMAGLVDRSALDTNQRFLGAVLVTPGGREWLQFADDTQPMPKSALEYLREIVDSDADKIRPITELQPWFSEDGDAASGHIADAR